MSDTGLAYVSRAFPKACQTIGLLYIRTSPCTLSTSYKAEGFIQKLSNQ
jgi:hypothetical protein